MTRREKRKKNKKLEMLIDWVLLICRCSHIIAIFFNNVGQFSYNTDFFNLLEKIDKTHTYASHMEIYLRLQTHYDFASYN